eukprot:1136908-Pelagomonas_calceolata.AAC.14
MSSFNCLVTGNVLQHQQKWVGTDDCWRADQQGSACDVVECFSGGAVSDVGSVEKTSFDVVPGACVPSFAVVPACVDGVVHLCKCIARVRRGVRSLPAGCLRRSLSSPRSTCLPRYSVEDASVTQKGFELMAMLRNSGLLWGALFFVHANRPLCTCIARMNKWASAPQSLPPRFVSILGCKAAAYYMLFENKSQGIAHGDFNSLLSWLIGRCNSDMVARSFDGCTAAALSRSLNCAMDFCISSSALHVSASGCRCDYLLSPPARLCLRAVHTGWFIRWRGRARELSGGPPVPVP